MQNKEIMEVIKSLNQNNDIKWKVLHNTNKHIVIINDYDNSVIYEILLNYGEDKQDIKVVNQHLKNTVCYLIYGFDIWCDFNNNETGVKQAIKSIVRHFYYYY